jgi:hypothetical protein
MADVGQHLSRSGMDFLLNQNSPSFKISSFNPIGQVNSGSGQSRLQGTQSANPEKKVLSANEKKRRMNYIRENSKMVQL